ncbi:acyl-CoA dehydrogenase family protein [Allostreptomyces psammosilenae]|uniref:3-hydroxy-9,10-secoandrosta-1,3,5(10)-triene-9, 17-dione monooxygenase n=1 Tax=Allostreptomyces psammosilenae TaxID=1892865 RepID=A0A852ZRX1_9ACTN|nr:acyl-CoA dehydrogenase family protein [Allostreptomyces psammosilenae]NYI03604.1 3-hydroxy-9,10-secoandrosta-1,3,5(10)-triene-9,17-dione monooxygenase [Allostreptomyces psammosilenae]
MNDTGPPPPGADPEVCERVDALAGRWRERAAIAERARRLPRETIAELSDAGLLHIVAPTRHGGPGYGWPTLVEAARRAARACPSTGWVIGVVGGHAALAGRLPEPVTALLFADGPRQLFATASAAADGRITRVAGGVEVTGRWRFCSAVDHAEWIIVNGPCRDATGAAGTDGTAGGERVLVPLRTDRVRVEDDWYVSGMSATGSRTIAVDGEFVPEERVDPLSRCFAERWSKESAPTDYLGEVPFRSYATSSIIGPLLGCAEGAFEAYLAGLRTPAGRPSPRSEQPLVRDGLTESAAELACARHLYDAVCATLHAAGVERRALSAAESATVSRDRAYLARLCERAVHRLVRLTGTAAHLEDHPLARHWRDVQMMAAHRDVSWALTHHAYAAVAVGGPSTPPEG